MLTIIATALGIGPAKFRLFAIGLTILSVVTALGVAQNELKAAGARELQRENDAKIVAANYKLADASSDYLVAATKQAVTTATIVKEIHEVVNPWSATVITVDEKCRAAASLPDTILKKLNKL